MISNWNQFYPYAVELNVDAVDLPEVRTQNPNYVDGKPAFSFGYSSESSNKRFKKILAGEKGNGIELTHVFKLRSDLLTEISVTATKGRAKKYIEERAEVLRSRG